MAKVANRWMCSWGARCNLLGTGIKDGTCSVDLILVCGDFQAVRCASDLDHMVCPAKFKKIGDFADYHSGKKLAPVPTLFIGGNHEASNFLWENY